MMFRKPFFALAATVAAALLLPAAPAAAQAAKLVAASSAIGFTSKQLGVPVDGQFKRFDARIVFDPRNPAAGKLALSIDTASATLGVPEADLELPTPTWFHVARFPQASFQSSAIKALGGGRFEVAGKLAIKGSVRELLVPVQLAQTGSTSTATGSFTIPRLAFKIGDGEWADTSIVADDVQVRFRLVLTGLAPL